MKKSKLTKLLALLLIAAMAVSMLSVTAFADNEEQPAPGVTQPLNDEGSENPDPSASGGEDDKNSDPSASGGEDDKNPDPSASGSEDDKNPDPSANGNEGDEEEKKDPADEEKDPAGDAPAPIDEEPVTAFYVSADGDDNNPGTEAEPFATLKKAADEVNKAEGSSFTVYVMTALTSTACARFYNKNVTLTSYGGTHTVSRGEDFAPISDDARSFYNPAMIEIQGYGDGKPGLTLSNIIFDDDGKHMGNVYAQAISGEGRDDNTKYVQDAIVASNATAPCTINIEPTAQLLNYGGMSAVRVTSAAHVNMNGVISGSGPVQRNGGNGPAGAIWIQGASAFVGGSITNLTGRGVYVDGGSATINGTISNITPANLTWQGAEGTGVHVRGGGTVTLNGTISGNADNPSKYGVAVKVDSAADGAFVMNKGAVIKDMAGAVNVSVSAKVYIDGEITGIHGNNTLNLQDGGYCRIGENAEIHHNTLDRTAVYFQTSTLELYGKIHHNFSKDKSGGVEVNNNTYGEFTMYDGAEITDNYGLEHGAGVLVCNGPFTMKGGLIARNVSGTAQGGGVCVRRGGQFIMEGGQIVDNISAGAGGGVAYDAAEHDQRVMPVNLIGGTISGNLMNASVSTSGGVVQTSGGVPNDVALYGGPANINLYVNIHPGVTVDRRVYLTNGGDNRYITITDGTEIGIPSGSCVSALKTAAQAKGWADPYTNFWCQNGEAVDVTVTKAVPNAALPVYVVAIPTDAKGAPVTGAVPEVCIAAVSGNNVSFALPNGNANGYAVGLVQPTQDFGALTATATDTIQKIHGGSGKYISNWGLDYSISENLANVIEQADGKDANLSLTVNLDSRLGNPDNIALESNIFEIDGEPAIDADANTVTVNLKLKSGWKDKLAAAACALSGTAELNDTDDALAYIMNTSGYVSGNVGSIIVSVPSDVAHTRVLAVKSVTLHFDANGGSNPPADMTQYIGALGTSTFTIPAAAPTNNGILFEGWSLTRNGAPAYGAGHAATIAIADDTTLYAVWHTHVFGDWLSDANNHWRECPYDGAVANLGPHTYGPWTVTVEPTTTAPGVQQRVCTVCGHAQQAALAQIPVINPVPGVPAPIAPLNPTDIDEPETPLAEEPAEQLPDEETPLSSEHGIGCIIHWILLAAALVVLVVYIITAENEKKKIKKLKEQLGL